MCIVCEYINLTDSKAKQKILKISEIFFMSCPNVQYIPLEFKNLKTLLGLNNTNITIIPKQLTKLIEIDCSKTRIQLIPRTLTNLTYLDCSSTLVGHISSNLTNLNYLNCSNTLVTKIPKTLINLKEIECEHSKIIKIPKSLIKLEYLDCSNTPINYIPKTLINLTYLDCSNTLISKLEKSIIKRQKKIKKGFLGVIILYKRYKLFKILWKIAEYYTAIKYAPSKILNYIELD
jgi:Leucine-rich repeat (LRR) protein